MEKISFDQAVRELVVPGHDYKSDGYFFLRDALEYTVDALRKDELEEHRHVSGAELAEGVVECGLKEYGIMAVSVLDSWGISSTEDIGKMVFNLIESGAFGRSEEDSLEDFVDVLDLRSELMAPFRPSRQVIVPRVSGSDAEPPARGNQPAKPSEI